MENQNLKPHLSYFYQWEKEKANQPFLKQPFGDQWKTISYAEAGQQARKMVTALQKMGLNKGDHIGILSKNCCHWILSDLAIMMGGFVSVPFYASLPKAQLAEVVVKSDIKAIFVGKLDQWGERAEAIPDQVTIIRYPHYQGNAQVTQGEHWDDLVKANQAFQENYLPPLDNLWTILFTSGTTGSPKGVMHSFKSPAMIMANEKETNFIGMYQLKGKRFFSFLPLNHVAERIGVELPAIVLGGTISFVESLDTFAKNLQDTQPSLIFAVPRIWTKFYLGVIDKLPQKKIDLFFKIPFLKNVIKKKLLTALGLRHAEVVATGAAITPQFIKVWYKKLGIHLIEAYGMTEVCGSITNGPASDTPPDSVGEAVPGCEIKLVADTGEILMKSPWAMLGYYKDPEKTAQVLRDGWIYSGDKGTIDDNGYLRVIGRVKDAFKTSKGKYVVPNPMEEILAKNDFIEQVCISGSTIPQPIALVNLSELAIKAPKLEVEQSLKDHLSNLNKDLANYQKVSTIVINKDHWSEENELLTPTLKVRRGKIDDCYSVKYLSWHESDETIIWE